MDKYNFYIPLNDIPYSKDNDLYCVSSDQINEISLLAVSFDGVTKDKDCKVALKRYFAQAKADHLYEPYTHLTSKIIGETFLHLAIELNLLEMTFRKNGITEERMNFYNLKQKEFINLLNYNNFQYGDKGYTKKL